MKPVADIITKYNLIRTVELEDTRFKQGNTIFFNVNEICNDYYILTETKRLLKNRIRHDSKQLRKITG